MEYWNGALLDFMECWTGVLDWSAGEHEYCKISPDILVFNLYCSN
jgi:hypothetical protein